MSCLQPAHAHSESDKLPSQFVSDCLLTKYGIHDAHVAHTRKVVDLLVTISNEASLYSDEQKERNGAAAIHFCASVIHNRNGKLVIQDLLREQKIFI